MDYSGIDCLLFIESHKNAIENNNEIKDNVLKSKIILLYTFKNMLFLKKNFILIVKLYS